MTKTIYNGYKAFAKDLIERAIKTFCQTLVALIGTTATIGEVDWKLALSSAELAALLSVLTSIGSKGFGSEDSASLVD